MMPLVRLLGALIAWLIEIVERWRFKG